MSFINQHIQVLPKNVSHETSLEQQTKNKEYGAVRNMTNNLPLLKGNN